MSFNIDQVELYHVRLRLKSKFQTSFGEEQDRECVLIRLLSDGEQGWGECVAGAEPGFSYETVGTAWHVLESFFIPALYQGDVRSPEELHHALRAYRGHPLAKAGLEMAIWDLQGRLRGESFAALIGGAAARIPVGVSIGIQEKPELMLEQIAGYLTAGYQRIKIKIAPGADLDVLDAVRNAYPDLRLWVDANAAYSPDESEFFKRLDTYQLELIEQPLYDDDLVEHAALQRTLSTDLCLDESIHHLRDARHAVELGSCRVINIKPGRVGGYLMACEIESFCRFKSIPVWCGGMLETGIGRAANLAIASRPGFSLPGDISASDRYYENDIAIPAFTLNEDSTIDVPRGPGLGVEVDLEFLKKAALKTGVFRRNSL